MAADPQVGVVNLALRELGRARVTDLTESSLQRNAAARDVLSALDESRDALLERHGWLFALRYAAIAPAAALPDGITNWKYASLFQMPADALRVWEVRDPGLIDALWTEVDLAAFSIVGPVLMENLAWERGTIDTDIGALQVIWSNHSCPLAVSYTRRCSYAAMSQAFRDGLGYEAAGRVAYAVTGNPGLAEALAKKREQALAEAIGLDAVETGGQQEQAPSIPQLIRMMAR